MTTLIRHLSILAKYSVIVLIKIFYQALIRIQEEFNEISS